MPILECPALQLLWWHPFPYASEMSHLSVQGPLIQLVSCSNPAADPGGLFSWFERIFFWQGACQLL